MLLANFCHAYGKVLPCLWQSFANAVTKSCQEDGKTLPICRQKERERGRKFITHRIVFSKRIRIFVMHWFAPPPPSGKAIKRESGVNPGQSRCCKFRATLQTITLCHWNTLPGRRLQQKQVRRPAMHTLSLLSRKKR